MLARRLRLAIAQPNFFIAIFEFDGFLNRIVALSQTCRRTYRLCRRQSQRPVLRVRRRWCYHR